MTNLECFCGCDSFNVYMSNHHFCLVCECCKCERVIMSPGVAVSKYEVSVPFSDKFFKVDTEVLDKAKKKKDSQEDTINTGLDLQGHFWIPNDVYNTTAETRCELCGIFSDDYKLRVRRCKKGE